MPAVGVDVVLVRIGWAGCCTKPGGSGCGRGVEMGDVPARAGGDWMGAASEEIVSCIHARRIIVRVTKLINQPYLEVKMLLCRVDIIISYRFNLNLTIR
jgi:hypothetical protein